MKQNSRYYVDSRVGCVAVREKIDGHISNGLHPELHDVVAYWSGIKLSEKEQPFGSNCFWNVEQWKLDKAEALCALLNGDES